MIIDKRGDILTSNASYIVIPVNTVGVMGKELALQAKRRWPKMDADHRAWCRASPTIQRFRPVSRCGGHADDAAAGR